MLIWDLLVRAVLEGGRLERPAGEVDRKIAELIKLGMLEREEVRGDLQVFLITNAGVQIAMIYDGILRGEQQPSITRGASADQLSSSSPPETST